ncbi:Hint domain-containing protein [Acidisphaera sp. S103]|uniref:Hint domain-containing protein n=1 Tax=Acidisphaera sp. S103 TaxID=1747223 RepID=UPI00131E5750|nr:Hint domain-containing protein [Acidisphaera sp. S103]
MTTKTLPDSTSSYYTYTGSGVTLVNTGVQGKPGASGLNFGFIVSGNNDTLVNDGTVFGQHVPVYITGSGGSVINAAGKYIAATEPVQGGVNFYNFSGTVTNYGTISGAPNATNGEGGNAVEMRHGGLVTNFGTLENGGALFRLAPGTLVNTGVILGNAAYGGVYMQAGGTVTNLAGGQISSNGATESYHGAPPYGVFIHGAAGTVTNVGTIDGGSGNAVLLSTGFQNRVIVDPGAVFVGTINGGTAVDATLELASSVSQGVLSGIGTQFINFGTLAFDPSASWRVNATTSIASATITGFGATDTIDLGGFVAVSDTFSANTLVLTNASNAHVTLHMQGTFATANFTLANDGDGGTDLGFATLAPAALVYGQTIDETGIVATTETVSAGVMTLFNAGGTAVGTISVGTSLATGDFTLRSDGSGGTDVIVDTIFGTYESGVTLLTNPTTIASTASVSATTGAALSNPGGANWSITNYGSVNGATNANGIQLGNGDTLVGGSTITNEAGGLIRGRYGMLLYNGTNDLIVNLAGATIAAAGATADRAIDMEVDSGVVVNAGLILSQTGGAFDVGVELDGGGSLTNTATGTITGGWGVLVSGTGTVTNAGTISGAFSGEFAVALGSGDRLIVDPGAVFSGAVNGGWIGGSSTLELASAASAGTLSTTNFTNFSTIDFDTGATWTVQGSTTALSGSIFGFTLGDTIDLTGFAAVSETFVSNTLVLTNAGGTHQTLHVQGNLLTGNFAISNDGDGGTDIAFGTAPLLYGQTIDEAGIVAVTETVSTGVMTLFNGGGTAVGTIAVGGTLNSSDFTLAPDGSGGTDVIVSTVFGTYASGVTLLTNPTTIASSATVNATSGAALYGPGGTNWTVTNYGAVNSTTGANGVQLGGNTQIGSGALTNAAGGVISGRYGIQVYNSSDVDIVNLAGGTIAATGTTADRAIDMEIGAGTVTNAGLIASQPNGAFDVGVELDGGGTVINTATGTIAGGWGVLMSGAGTVVNAGTISGTFSGEFAVALNNGDRLIVDPGAVFVGAVNGGRIGGSSTLELASAASAGTLAATNFTNFSTIDFDAGAAWTLQSATTALSGAIVGFTFGDTVDLTGFAAVSETFASNALVLTNASNAHVTLNVQGNFASGNFALSDDDDGGTNITEQPYLAYGQTVDETGVVATTETVSAGVMTLFNGGGTAVGSIAVGGTLDGSDFTLRSDGAGGTDVIVSTIFGTYTSSVTLLTNPTTIASTASISGTVSGVPSLFGPAGTAWTVTNEGTIHNAGTSTYGISFAGGGTITNAAGGVVYGHNGGIAIYGTGASVLNLGHVQFSEYGPGVILKNGGTVINGQAGGTASSASISGYNYGVQIQSTGTAGEIGSVVNYGTIDSPGGKGVSLVNGAFVNGPSGATGALVDAYVGVCITESGTVINFGSIAYTGGGNGNYGILMVGAGTVGNAGLIEAQIGIEAHADAFVLNAGSIISTGGTSGVAIQFAGGTNLLVAEPGAVFVGSLSAAGTTTLELGSGGAGTLAGFGDTVTNFTSLVFEAGAQWTVAGDDSDAGLGTLGIGGFTFGDTIDLTGFAAVSSTFASDTLVLTDAGGGHDTLSIEGAFVSGNFHLSSDGTGGTDIAFGAPPLLYGETIDEVGIIATSETVTTGVMTLFAGASPVGTIAVGTTLDTGDFTLRPNGPTATDVIVSTVFGTYTSSVTLLTNPTTIAGTASITGSVTGGIGVIGPSGTTWTLVNQGLIDETGIASQGISFASAGTITNATGGVIEATNAGIRLNAGGSVTNQSGGTISGKYGIYGQGAAATVVNTGSIVANPTSGFAVLLTSGGTVTNLSGGTISGLYGVRASTDPATVVNAGSIGNGSSLSTGEAIALRHGGSVTNLAGGQIIAGREGIYIGGAAGTVVNAGTISGGSAAGFGIIIATAGAITNQSGGVITGQYGIRGDEAAVTVINAGSIDGNLTVGEGIYFNSTGSVTNQAGGIITGLKAVEVTGGSVTNAGAIGGNTTLATGAGVALISGGSFTNQSGGTVTGFVGVYGKTSAATVVNAGGIYGNTISGRGVSLAAGGSVNNLTTGVITGFDGVFAAGGATVVNAGSIGGTNAVIFASGAANRLVFDPGAVFSGLVDGGNAIGATAASTLELAPNDDAGTLSGLGTQFIHFAQVVVDAGARWTLSTANTVATGVTLTNAGSLTATGTLQNDGSIIGTGGTAGDYGIVIGAAGILSNLGAGSLIQGYDGVLVGVGGTVTNAGTIGSTQGVDGVALRFTGGTARLIDDPGAVFAGTVNGGGSATLELASAASAGVITGLGVSVTNFTSLVFDAGAQWTVAGNDVPGGLGTLGIGGFTLGDTIDLTGFAAVSETFASNTLVLTNAGGDHDSLNIQGAFATDNFLIGNDGDGGTDISFVIPPTIAAGGTVTFTGGGPAVTLDSTLSITDQDSTTLVAGTVSIGGFLAGDTLNFSNQNGIIGNFDTATGTLTLTGSATVADYQAALDSITYGFDPTDGDPTDGGDTTRTINWTVNDGAASSPLATSTLDTVHVAPTITTEGTVSFTGGGNSVALDPTLTLTDVDSGGLLNGGTVSIAGFVSGDILSADTIGTSITASFDSLTGVLTLTGSDTLTDYQDVLRSVTYSFNPTDGDPTGGGGDTSRTIDWLVTDGATTNAVSSTGTSTLDTVHVGPTITAAGTVAYVADGTATVLDSAVTITDVDSTGTVHAATVSIGNGFTLGDLLNFTTQNGIIGNYDTATGTLTLSGDATIGDYQTALDSITYTFTPDGGDPTAAGTDPSRTISWTVNDGVDTSAAASSTLDISLPSPVIDGTAAGQATTDEATIDPFSGVSITDPNSGQTETITITVSNGGTLSDADGTLSGTGLTKTGTGTYTLAAGSPTAVTAELDALVFTPTAHQVVPGGTVTTGFTLAVTDTLSQSATDSSTSVVATAVNDPPAITGAVAGQTTTDESTLSPFSGVAISDVDIGQTETVTVTLSDTANGALSNLGGGGYDSVTGVYSVTGSDSAVTIALDGLVFTPTVHQVAPGGSVTTTFTIAATDTAGGTHSNSTTSVVATAVNDQPVISGAVAGQITTDEATIDPFSGAGISDVDFGQTETVTVTLSNDANGTLSNLDGGSYDSGTGIYSVTGSDAAVTTALDSLVFTPTAHQVAPGGSVTTTFTIAATDTAGGIASDDTTTVTATAVNDPPVITGTVAGQRMSDNATIRPFFGVTISDPDVGASETVTITLTYGGTPTDVYGTLSGAGLSKIGNGIYTLAAGSPGAVTTALDALIFTAIPDQVVPGRTITIGMTLSVTDGIVGTPTTDTTTSVNSIACFAAGTRIATPRGTVTVERLREGDVVLTVSGKARPVQWIGRRTLDCNRHIAPERVKPVRIAPHAFGEDRPRRALLLSPDHSVFIEDVMIPIKHLINGSTVTQIDVPSVTYYHIELESHDVVLAEGLPAETYLETGGRSGFENSGGVIDLHPDFAPDENRVGMVWRNFAYAPLIGTDGQLDRVRVRLTLQAVMLGQQGRGEPQREKRVRRAARP